MRAAALLLIPAFLAACQTQQQRCEARAVQDLRVVNALIDYDDGWGGGGLCWGNQVFTTDEAVAVNLDEQRATLRSLQAKRKELEVQARAQLDACAAAAPG